MEGQNLSVFEGDFEYINGKLDSYVDLPPERKSVYPKTDADGDITGFVLIVIAT